MTKNTLLKRGTKNSGMGRPPPIIRAMPERKRFFPLMHSLRPAHDLTSPWSWKRGDSKAWLQTTTNSKLSTFIEIWIAAMKTIVEHFNPQPSILKSCHQVTKKLPHFVVLLMPICSEYVLLIGCLEVHTLQCRTFHRCHHQNAPLGLCLAILLWIRCFNTD